MLPLYREYIKELNDKKEEHKRLVEDAKQAKAYQVAVYDMMKVFIEESDGIMSDKMRRAVKAIADCDDKK